MLTTLHLENFKAFADEQRIPLKPLTLVFGANSSGKSSILHALLLAKEAIKDGGSLNADRTEAGGDSVDLGGFLNYVNSHNTERDVRMAFEMTAPARANGRQDDILSRARKVAIDFAFGYDSRRQTTIPRRYEVLLDAMTAMVLFYSGGEEEMEQQQPIAARQINLDHPLVRETCEASLLSAGSLSERQRDSLTEIINNLVPEVRGTAEPFLPASLSVAGHPVGMVSESMKFSEDPETMMQFMLRWSLLDPLVFGARHQLTEELARLVYLGPLRAYPPRLLMRSQHRDPIGESTGLNAWQALFNDESARAEVNVWLGAEKLKTPYEVVVERLRPAGTSIPAVQAIWEWIDYMVWEPAAGESEETWDEAFALIKECEENLAPEQVGGLFEKALKRVPPNLSFDEETGEWKAVEVTSESDPYMIAIAALMEMRDTLLQQGQPGDLEQLVIVDKRADNMRVTHRDIGMGISQVLPVLVNAIAPRDSLVMIEQPEIHIHPALQAELGDVFIESALGERKNRFILETHSEHLILRIMRRMRETSQGRCPENLRLTPDDVAVLYVEREGAKSFVREMRLDEEGDFIDAWPDGFFEEGYREVFA